MEKIAVLGLGYVGLPLALALGRAFKSVVGFDIDTRRVAALKTGEDWTGEVSKAELASSRLTLTTDVEALRDRTFFIVTVPTPIDQAKRPDLRPLLGACATVGAALKGRTASQGAPVPLIVFESTVYPGLTEEICGPALAKASGLRQGVDFKLGYSPERINPGDTQNRVETITKIISAEDSGCVDRLESVYGRVITAGVYRATSIRVAEAAKVLENTQRDVNIALMNELALICDKLGIRTRDVLDAAGTKWNFLKFAPGLVGGHCIGVDPYYLTARAEELGYHPEMILSGRRLNDSMAVFVAQKIAKLLIAAGRPLLGSRVAILGLAFKENVRDLRNSKVPDIVAELRQFGVEVMVHDPLADPAQAQHEYGLALCAREDLTTLDALVLAVPHKALLADLPAFLANVRPGGCVIDVKSSLPASTIPKGLLYWSL